ncbi:conserved hypothetical protein [Ricinus communis]|uniref:Uncharacterized protein n=1 Tax=Ricinus communis TaxID=3988 RepID=B9TC27_RICCO|nr:conserved hypothetical protein [Ricinus communis]
MVLDETIQIPHYAVGWGSAPLLYSRVAPLLCEAGRSVFLWRNHTRKKIEKAFKKERESDGQP